MGDKTNGFRLEDGDFEEVKIPVPWGHISGKWWGPRSRQPVLAVHGWQDNAGTFDTLAPLLVSRGHSLLCVDLPGHGLSSPYPEGLFYYLFWDGIPIIRRIVRHFGWDKVTLMGHSLGGAQAFLYAAVYPSEVEAFVQFDIASPSVRSQKSIVSAMGGAVDKFFAFETMSPEKVPCYKYDDMLDIVYEAHGGGVTRPSCQVLMRRGMRSADHKPGHYVFCRDPRLKVAGLGFMSSEQVMEFASRIRCRVLNIRGNPGLKFEFPEYYDRVLDAVEEAAEAVERHVVEGSHHLHLNNPERVVDLVDRFLS